MKSRMEPSARHLVLSVISFVSLASTSAASASRVSRESDFLSSFFPDFDLWTSQKLWPVYCRAMHPGLARTPARFVVDHKTDFNPAAEDIPVFVQSHNNPTYLHAMVRFLRCYGAKVVVWDNGSSLRDHIRLLKVLDRFVEVRRLGENKGARSFFTRENVALCPKFFAFTDADLRTDPDLPPRFLEFLANVTQAFPGRKAGFALDVSRHANFMKGSYFQGKNISEWESQWWPKPVEDPPVVHSADPLMLAGLDTTFAVYDRDALLLKSSCTAEECFTFDGVRVGGSFLATHVPWFCYFPELLKKTEYAAYFNSNIKSTAQNVGSTVGTMLQNENGPSPSKVERSEIRRNFC